MSTTKSEQLFGNFLSRHDITTTRLLNFGDDTRGRLSADNGDGRFTDILKELTDNGNALRSSVIAEEVAITLQKGATLTTNEVLEGFKFTMGDSEDGISYSLGGKKTPAFLEFYPRGMTEYSNVTKEQMPTLTGRVFDAANNNKAKLPVEIYNKLIVFKDGWLNARTDQDTKKGGVAAADGSSDNLRTTFEKSLLKAIHFVGFLYPGNVEHCTQYFNFSILYSSAKHEHQTTSGSLQPAEKKLALTRVFTSVSKIIATNKDNDATYLLWFAASADETPPATAIEIGVGQSKELKPLDIGNDTAHPLLMLKNLSTLNVCDYIVETVG